MRRELIDGAVALLTIPAAYGYGYWRYHKHLFGIYTEEEKLSYSEEKIPFDGSTQKVIDELMGYITERWSPYHVAAVRWFWSNTKDPVVRGSTSTRSGILIGVPYSFSYQSLADIDTSKIVTTGNVAIDKDSAEGQKLLSSLVLSEDAKKFALARELHFVNSKYVHINSLSGLVFGGVGLLGAAKMNRSSYFNIIHTKLPFRVLIYVSIGFSAVHLNQEFLKWYFKRHNLGSDSETVRMGKEFAIGGIEYLSKVLKRNQTLRKLGGKTSEEMYSAVGDEVMGYFSVNPPVPLRMRHLIEQARKLYGEDEKINEIIENTVQQTTPQPV